MKQYFPDMTATTLYLQGAMTVCTKDQANKTPSRDWGGGQKILTCKEVIDNQMLLLDEVDVLHNAATERLTMLNPTPVHVMAV